MVFDILKRLSSEENKPRSRSEPTSIRPVITLPSRTVMSTEKMHGLWDSDTGLFSPTSPNAPNHHVEHVDIVEASRSTSDDVASSRLESFQIDGICRDWEAGLAVASEARQSSMSRIRDEEQTAQRASHTTERKWRQAKAHFQHMLVQDLSGLTACLPALWMNAGLLECYTMDCIQARTSFARENPTDEEKRLANIEAVARGHAINALQNFKSAISHDLSDPLPHFFAGCATFALGQHEVAKACFDCCRRLMKGAQFDYRNAGLDWTLTNFSVNNNVELCTRLINWNRSGRKVKLIGRTNIIGPERSKLFVIPSWLEVIRQRNSDATEKAATEEAAFEAFKPVKPEGDHLSEVTWRPRQKPVGAASLSVVDSSTIRNGRVGSFSSADGSLKEPITPITATPIGIGRAWNEVQRPGTRLPPIDQAHPEAIVAQENTDMFGQPHPIRSQQHVRRWLDPVGQVWLQDENQNALLSPKRPRHGLLSAPSPMRCVFSGTSSVYSQYDANVVNSDHEAEIMALLDDRNVAYEKNLDKSHNDPEVDSLSDGSDWEARLIDLYAVQDMDSEEPSTDPYPGRDIIRDYEDNDDTFQNPVDRSIFQRDQSYIRFNAENWDSAATPTPSPAPTEFLSSSFVRHPLDEPSGSRKDDVSAVDTYRPYAHHSARQIVSSRATPDVPPRPPAMTSASAPARQFLAQPILDQDKRKNPRPELLGNRKPKK